MLGCLQQLYCHKGIYLDRTEPRGGQSEFGSFSRVLWQKLSNAVGLLPPPTGSRGQRENLLLLFPLVRPLALCLVLAEGYQTSNTPHFLGKQFSLLHSFVFISLIIFLKIFNCSRVESSEVYCLIFLGVGREVKKKSGTTWQLQESKWNKIASKLEESDMTLKAPW